MDRIFHPGHEGSGVLNAVRKDLVSSGEVTLETDSELTWTKLHIQGCTPLYTGCFYGPPNNDTTPVEEVDKSRCILTHNQSLPDILLTGDFNAPDIIWEEEGYTVRPIPNIQLESTTNY